MSQAYRHGNTNVSLVNYHFVWCPRRRRRVITGKLEQRLKTLIKEACDALDCVIIALETMPDHVHLFVNTPSTIAPSILVGRIKGHSSKTLRDEFPVLQRMPSTWTRSYFVCTAGNISSGAVKRYIEAQKTRG
ncbi:MAG: IS200/IS605 family transposase [Gammaproteobacteria bacterium]